MVLSRAWNAHVTSFFEIDLTRVARIRAKQRPSSSARPGEKLTFLPFVIKAVVDGLEGVPDAQRGRARHRRGAAQAVQHRHRGGARLGAHRPRHQERRRPVAHGPHARLNDLANRARPKKLQPAEVQGATFTITNPGVFGSLMGTPIIPCPTSAILGVGAIEKRPR
jgi:2-oxoglutarate dehydrogenase E2 component (dihydrolipoamide succinyltransferase)